MKALLLLNHLVTFVVGRIHLSAYLLSSIVKYLNLISLSEEYESSVAYLGPKRGDAQARLQRRGQLHPAVEVVQPKVLLQHSRGDQGAHLLTPPSKGLLECMDESVKAGRWPNQKFAKRTS